jgi:Ca2+-binding RTX toxin-like protein
MNTSKSKSITRVCKLAGHMRHCLLGVSSSILLLSPAIAQEFPANINLSGLNGVTGFQLNGEAADNTAGYSVGGAGDINGDGFDDVIVGAVDANAPSNQSGASYVVFGSSTVFPANFQLSSLNGTNGFQISGETESDFSGFSVDGAGDVNRDGFDDVVIGALDADPGGVKRGRAYVVFGKASGFASDIALSSLNGNNGFKITGQGGGVTSDDFGVAVAGAGDINGDGFADIIVGASGHANETGAAYVIFGKSAKFAADIKVTALNGNNGFKINGSAPGDHFGDAVDLAGDFNGDGLSDMIVGAPTFSGVNSGSGAAYVLFGRSSSFPSSINVASLPASRGFRLTGTDGYDNAGKSVSMAGDFDGDGFDDVLVGAPFAGASSEGLSYLVYGKSSVGASAIDLGSLLGSVGMILKGENSSDSSGRSARAAGDVNRDGFADVVIGSPGSDFGFAEGGVSHVVLGTPVARGNSTTQIALSAMSGTNGFQLSGEAVDQNTGKSVAGVGDMNGDGLDDLVLGAPGSSPNGSGSGASYIMFGRAPVTAVERFGSDAAQAITGGSQDDFLWGGNGNDELEGRGGADVLEGSEGNNTASYANATASVAVSLGNPAINTGQADGDSYFNIANLRGSRFADNLTGDGGKNRLAGGKSKDILRGGKGKDTFAYLRLDDSPAGSANRDEIADFDPGSSSSAVDKIDLSAIDANPSKNGNQAFVFIGTNGFSGKKGQLKIKKSGGNVIVQADTNGNKAADLEILLKGVKISKLRANDFKL